MAGFQEFVDSMKADLVEEKGWLERYETGRSMVGVRYRGGRYIDQTPEAIEKCKDAIAQLEEVIAIYS